MAGRSRRPRGAGLLDGLELALSRVRQGHRQRDLVARFAGPDRRRARRSPFALYPDDRGYFLEVQRIGQGLAAAFPPETTQVSAALNYPGTIKAFHYHLHQTDCWTPAMGMLQVALVDLRLGSPTFGERNTHLRRRAAALADSDSAGSGARLQGRSATGRPHAGLHDRPLLQSARTKAAFPTTMPPSTTTGKRSINSGSPGCSQ